MAYTIKEVMQLGLIASPFARGNSPTSNYIYINNEIKAGRLKAKNIGYGKKKARYIVTKEAIEQWLKEYR